MHALHDHMIADDKLKYNTSLHDLPLETEKCINNREVILKDLKIALNAQQKCIALKQVVSQMNTITSQYNKKISPSAPI